MSSKNLEHFKSLLTQYNQVVFNNKNKNNESDISLDSITEALDSVEHVKIPDQVIIILINYLILLTNMFFLLTKQTVELLVTGCKGIGHAHELSRPFCQFFYKQMSKQVRKEEVEEKSLRD